MGDAHADGDDGVRSINFMNRVESYDGENEDLDNLDALLSTHENQPLLITTFLEDDQNVAEHNPHVTAYEKQLGPEDLQACLRQADWDRALDVLTLMVLNGQAVATGVDIVHEPLDIIRAHPELVLRLRGQACFDLIAKGDFIRAAAYYRNHIERIFPDGTAGHEFVDALLADINAMAHDAEPPSGEDHFAGTNETRKSVNDYLRIYFPDFRDVEIDGEGRMRVGLFGEKQDKVVRCLACHKVFKGYTPAKLQFHQLREPTGRQALCPASSEYIRYGSNSARPNKTEAAAAAAEQRLLPLPLLPMLDVGHPLSLFLLLLWMLDKAEQRRRPKQKKFLLPLLLNNMMAMAMRAEQKVLQVVLPA